MKLNQLIAALLLPCAAAAFAAPAKYVIVDHSTANLMDQATAEGIWLKSVTPATVKLFPAKAWGFLSQVEGGIDVQQKTCVITARAVVVPRKGKELMFKPPRAPPPSAPHRAHRPSSARRWARPSWKKQFRPCPQPWARIDSRLTLSDLPSADTSASQTESREPGVARRAGSLYFGCTPSGWWQLD